MHDVHREETEEKQVLEAELMWWETKKPSCEVGQVPTV
jgi:hypothetical protein